MGGFDLSFTYDADDEAVTGRNRVASRLAGLRGPPVPALLALSGQRCIESK
jgi:hypothetical protein